MSVKLGESQDYMIYGNGSSTQEICVEANKISMVEFPVTFSKLDDVMVTVSATTGDSTVCGAHNNVTLRWVPLRVCMMCMCAVGGRGNLSLSGPPLTSDPN